MTWMEVLEGSTSSYRDTPRTLAGQDGTSIEALNLCVVFGRRGC